MLYLSAALGSLPRLPHAPPRADFQLTDYKRLQVKALRLHRAIQSHSETALITLLISPPLISDRFPPFMDPNS